MKRNTLYQTQNFKDVVRKNIEQARLPDDQMKKLLAMQGAQPELNNQSGIQYLPNWLQNHKIWVSSAMLIATTILVVSVSINQRPNYTHQIALEVIENHLNLKPLDVKAQSMDIIRDYFIHLDFSPVYSVLLQNNFDLDSANLLGGRYCSIKGVTAAQLHYKKTNVSSNINNDIATFYQVAYDPNLHGQIPHTSHNESPISLTVKGLNVSLWVEKGLLLILVSRG